MNSSLNKLVHHGIIIFFLTVIARLSLVRSSALLVLSEILDSLSIERKANKTQINIESI